MTRVIEGPAGSGGSSNQDLGAGINYAKQNAGGMISAVKTLFGFFLALFSPAKKL